MSVVPIHVRNLQFKLLDLRFHLSNYLLCLGIPVLNRYLLKPQLRSYLHPNIQASYLQTNGNGYASSIKPWQIYRWRPASAVKSMGFQWT